MTRGQTARWQALTRAGIVLGVVLVAAGFAVRDIRARALVSTDYVALALWGVGIILTVVGLATNLRMFANMLTGRRAAEGANFALVVLLSLGLAALVCYISTRRFARLDWTGKGDYTLHSKTVNIVRGLDRDVEATIVFASAELQNPVAQRAYDSTRAMLDQFKTISKHVSVQEIDWSRDTTAERDKVERLRQRVGNESIPAPSVVFTTPESHAVVPLEVKPLPGSYQQDVYRAEFAGEEAFAEALTKVTESKKATLYFLTGHGERPMEPQEPGALQGPVSLFDSPEYSFSTAVKSLQKDNYDCKPLNLATQGAVPDDCAALIIAGPRVPLSEAEIKALRSYFDTRSGSALILVDPEAVSGNKTNLPALLAGYGITVHTEAVGVTTLPPPLSFQSAEVPVLLEGMADHQIISDLKGFGEFTFTWACPLEIAEQPPGAPPGAPPQAQKLLTGTEMTWGSREFKPDQRQAVKYKAGEDVAPPLVVGAVVEPPRPPAGMPVPPDWMDSARGPKLVVIGSSLSFVNHTLQQQTANLYLLENSINWMAGRMHMLGIPAKTMDFTQLPISDSQVALARYLFIGGLPLCIIVLGIAVWVARRR